MSRRWLCAPSDQELDVQNVRLRRERHVRLDRKNPAAAPPAQRTDEVLSRLKLARLVSLFTKSVFGSWLRQASTLQTVDKPNAVQLGREYNRYIDHLIWNSTSSSFSPRSCSML